MRRQLIALLAAALAVACGRDEALTPRAEAPGTVTIALAASDAGTPAPGGAYDPMDHLVVRIFNAQGGLVRKYTSREEAEARLELLAGTYRVQAEAGETGRTESAGYASFEKRLYRGEAPLEVVAGTTTEASVTCLLTAAAVEVRFEETVAQNFGDAFSVRIAADEQFDADRIAAGDVPALEYTADATGYFDLGEGETTLVWQFSGEHPQRGTIEKTGRIEGISMGGKYRLALRFSPDLPGYIEGFSIRVDTSTDDHDDTIVFSPDPEIAGEGFALEEPVRYASAAGVNFSRSYRATAMAPFSALTLTAGERQIDLLGETLAEGVEVTRNGLQEAVVTLSDAFFAAAGAGLHTWSLEAKDTKGGEASCSLDVRVAGLVPVVATDCDLWRNSVTLRAVAFDATDVVFGLRTAAGTWRDAAGTPAGEDMYSAQIGPEWIAAVDPQRSLSGSGELPPIFRTEAGTGVYAGGSYECRAVVDGQTLAGAFTAPEAPEAQRIPDGDMENASLSCWTTGNETTAFWGSGNNITKIAFVTVDLHDLCTQQDRDGSKCALLKSAEAGAAGINMLAAGNLFSGTFVKPSTQGTVGFGKRLEWTARPRALRVKYHATVGTVNYTKYKNDKGEDPIAQGQMDKARIFAAIVDWSKPREVSSGMSDPGGMWDPAATASLGEGPIVGYASIWIEQTTEGEQMLTAELPIYWYDTSTRPTQPYTVAISCSANAFGDYMNGCSGNRLYVDDFEWVY